MSNCLRRRLLFIASLTICVIGSSCLFSDDDFQPRRVLGPQPVITTFETKSTNEVADQLNPSELVLAVTVDGVSRAYPINMLTGPRREIVNDTLADRPIAATW